MLCLHVPSQSKQNRIEIDINTNINHESSNKVTAAAHIREAKSYRITADVSIDLPYMRSLAL
jgi:hypothetical protein